MRYEAITGLTRGQLGELSARVAALIGDVAAPGGRAAGRDRAVPVGGDDGRADAQEPHPGGGRGHLRGQPAHRLPALGPAAPADRPVLAGCVPHPAQIAGTNGTLLVADTPGRR